MVEFGFTNPILLDSEGGIIAGHGRVMAAKESGLAAVPCIVLAHLTPAQPAIRTANSRNRDGGALSPRKNTASAVSRSKSWTWRPGNTPRVAAPTGTTDS